MLIDQPVKIYSNRGLKKNSGHTEQVKVIVTLLCVTKWIQIRYGF